MKISTGRRSSSRYSPKSLVVCVLMCVGASGLVRGCSGPEGNIGSGTAKSELGQHTDIRSLAGSKWKLVDVRNFAGVASEPLPLMELQFHEARRELAICNRIEADYTLHANAELQLSKLVTTEIYCNASTAKLESFFMNDRILFKHEKDELTLYDGAGAILRLRPSAGK